MAARLDHSSLLASTFLFAPLCHLHAVGTLTKLYAVNFILEEVTSSSFDCLVLYHLRWSLVWNASYSYSAEASEDLDKEDTLTLIKPARTPSKEERSVGLMETKQKHVSGGSLQFNGDIEEDKRE